MSHGEDFAQGPSVCGTIERQFVGNLAIARGISEDGGRHGTTLGDQGVDDGAYVAQQELLGKIRTDGVHAHCSGEEGSGMKKEGEMLGTIWG